MGRHYSPGRSRRARFRDAAAQFGPLAARPPCPPAPTYRRRRQHGRGSELDAISHDEVWTDFLVTCVDLHRHDGEAPERTIGGRLSGVDPATAFGWTALLVGLVLVALTPPFQVPDEPNHFFRAYQIAEGGLVPRPTPTSVGGRLPQSLLTVAGMVMGDVAFRPDVKQDLDAWARAFAVPLQPGDRVEVPFANTAVTGPVAYLPQAVGIGVARATGAPALGVFYAGRLSSLLLCVLVTAVAIRRMPYRRWTCAMLALLPMTCFVRSSVSSDGPTLALSLLALALCTRLADTVTRGAGQRRTPRPAGAAASRPLGPDDSRQYGMWPLLGVAALLAMGKPPYAGITLLGVATPARAFAGARRHAAALLGLVAVIAIGQGAWLLALRGRTAVWAPGADPGAQLARIAEQPIDTAIFLLSDFVRSAPVLAHQAIGVLGWLDAPVSLPVSMLLGVTLLLVALGEPGPPAQCTRLRRLAAAIGIGGMLLVQAMNYVWWTAPGAAQVDGLQGRHLLPFVPLLFLALDAPAWIGRPLARLRPALVAAFLVTSTAATAWTVIERYYGE